MNKHDQARVSVYVAHIRAQLARIEGDLKDIERLVGRPAEAEPRTCEGEAVPESSAYLPWRFAGLRPSE